MTERKRASGFVLMDAAFSADAKFRRLERTAADPHAFAAAVGVFWLLLGDARRSKSPAIDWDDYDEYAPEVAQLKAARLLQEDGFDPEVFQRWAPAYKSPSDRTRAYPSVPMRSSGTQSTQSTNTSGHIRSTHVTNGVGGTGEGGSQTFMGWKPKSTAHMGQHSDCLVCAPLHPSKKGDAA